MSDLEMDTHFVNGVKIQTWETTISSANIIEVEAGTNGYHGGDTGHGGRTYIRIADQGGTDMEAKIPNDGRGVEICLGGDTELGTMIEALEFILNILKIQTSTSA